MDCYISLGFDGAICYLLPLSLCLVMAKEEEKNNSFFLALLVSSKDCCGPGSCLPQAGVETEEHGKHVSHNHTYRKEKESVFEDQCCCVKSILLPIGIYI